VILSTEDLLKLGSFSGTVIESLSVIDVVVVSEGGYVVAAIFLYRWHAALEGYIAHSFVCIVLPL
jgi:hypothetical protein